MASSVEQNSEKLALVELRRNLFDELADLLPNQTCDDFLLQFLKAQMFDVPLAAEMYRKQVEWRRRMNADRILSNYRPPEVLQKYFMGGIIGEDLDGSVLIVQTLGRVDFKGLMKSATKSDILRYHAYRLETIIHTFHQKPENYGKMSRIVTSIIDLDECSLDQMWIPGIKLFSEMMKSVEDNYPGMANMAVFINVPKFFPTLFRILSPLLSSSTKQNVIILGADYKEELLKYIDPYQLPVHYGGSKLDEDGDPMCSKHICYCGPVPPSYFLTLDDRNSTSLSLTRGSPTCVDIKTFKPNSEIRWKVLTHGHEIQMKIEYKGDDSASPGSNDSSLCMKKICSQIVPENDSVLCEKEGTYTFAFEVTASRFRRRKIRYSIDVIDQ